MCEGEAHGFEMTEKEELCVGEHMDSSRQTREGSAMGAHGLEQTDQKEVCEGKHKDSKYRQTVT